jgi:predicted alpha/beta-fold hydrolase
MEFTPAWFLKGPHAQTIWGRLTRPRRLVKTRREVVTTPDGDELVLDHLDAAASPAHFVLMHGLEGSSNSVYVQGLLALISARGASATAINFRSCAREPDDVQKMIPNRRPRFYHSGDTGDFDFVVRRLPARPIVAVGASLGGNAILKWLGENPEQTIVSAAAALSVPFDLAAGAAYLESAAGRWYVSRFLRTLKKKVIDVTRTFPETHLDVEAALAAQSFREFDNAATAPLHGFRDADDYYRQSSSLYYLGRIRTPALCINAEDDPFLPREALERARAAASPAVQIVTTPRGGHVGFIGGRAPWSCVYWAEEVVVDWLMQKVNR